MNWFTRAIDAMLPFSQAGAGPNAYGGVTQTFTGLDDPALLDYFRAGHLTGSGAAVTVKSALRNTSVLRCVTLISNAIGRLPLHLLDKQANGDDKKATAHPLFSLLHRKPNSFQTAFEFRRLMQRHALCQGNGYALPIRTSGVVSALIPIAPARVRVEQASDWTVTYIVTGNGGGETRYGVGDMFHLRGMSECGLIGDSLVIQAAESIGLALRAEEAAARIFRNGAMAGGALQFTKESKSVSPEAMARLKAQFAELYSGAENAGKWLLLEDGLEAKPLATTARDAQHLETRKHQIEEIARVFGVPRPFLMIDDTSWGTGIEQLGIYLVQHCLAPWFEAWEQAIWRTLLSPADQKRYEAKFNEAALLRGSMENQALYLRTLVGTGQDPQVISQNEARGFLDLSDHANGDGLSSGMAATEGVNVPAA